MEIYSFPTFNLAKILFTAEALGVDYQLHLLDIAKGEHKSPEHLQRHPMGKVPAVEYKGGYYFESNSICRLLAEDNDNRLFSDDACERANINQWVDLMAHHIGRWLAVPFFEQTIKPHIGGTEDTAAVDEAMGFLEQQLPVLDKALLQHQFIAAETMTIADTIAYAYCRTQEHSSVDLSGYANIQRWYTSMSRHASIIQGLKRLPNGSILPFGA